MIINVQWTYFTTVGSQADVYLVKQGTPTLSAPHRQLWGS
jgi:hypothetical protein